VIPSSYAETAGFTAGDEVLAIQGKPTPSWESAVLALLDAGLDTPASFPVSVRDADGHDRELRVTLDESTRLLGQGNLLENFGIKPWRPVYPSVIDRLEPGSPAERAGMLAGDVVVSADGAAVTDCQWLMSAPAGANFAIQVRPAMPPEPRPDAGWGRGRGRDGQAYRRLCPTSGY
jgi:regulator of sigma E protease